VNTKLGSSGQRLKGMDKSCIGSQSPQWTPVFEEKQKKKNKKIE
jgi:hypothetical protein